MTDNYPGEFTPLITNHESESTIGFRVEQANHREQLWTREKYILLFYAMQRAKWESRNLDNWNLYPVTHKWENLILQIQGRTPNMTSSGAG